MVQKTFMYFWNFYAILHFTNEKHLYEMFSDTKLLEKRDRKGSAGAVRARFAAEQSTASDSGQELRTKLELQQECAASSCSQFIYIQEI
jgi:hypothetical protein